MNIALALEFIKHFRNYSDDELINNFYFNYLVNYAVGVRTLGEINFAEKTLYDFRSRVYRHTITDPEQEDLILAEFLNLAKGFLQTAHLTAIEQRMD